MTLKTISYTTARNKFARILDEVCDNREPIIIARKNARPVVLLSLAEYESMEETAYLLMSPVNAARLATSLGQVSETKRENFTE